MTRKREIRFDEVDVWLGVLLDAAFDPATQGLRLDQSAAALNAKADTPGLRKLSGRDGLSQLLALASDFTNYPDDYTDARRSDLLLAWVAMWLQVDDWSRLQGRVRKRRERKAVKK